MKLLTMLFSPALIAVLSIRFDLEGYGGLFGNSGDGWYASVRTVPSAIRQPSFSVAGIILMITYFGRIEAGWLVELMM